MNHGLNIWMLVGRPLLQELMQDLLLTSHQ